MDYETKRPLIEKLDQCLLDHAAAAGTKEGGPDITDVYRLWGLSETHYYLKVEHDFKPNEVEALLQFSDPLTVARECWEERPPDKGFPICGLIREIKAYERFPLVVDPKGYAQQKAEQLQLLKDRLDQNMSDFQTELLSMDKAEIITKSTQITAMREAHDFLKKDFIFSPDDVAVLLNMENPLKFIADMWPSDIGTLLYMEDQIRGAIEDAGKMAAVQRDAEVVQALNELLDKNMADFDATISDMTAEEIAEIDEITSMREIYSFLRDVYEFEPREAELLLRMENPLKLLVDNYPCFDLVELATNALESETIAETGKEAVTKREIETVTSAQKQDRSSEVQATLQMQVDTDFNLFGKMMGDTLETIQKQGFVLQDGILQKAETAKLGTIQQEQETAAVRAKPSVLGQLREAAREVSQRFHQGDRAKGGEAR